MLPTIIAQGADSAFHLLTGVARRAADSSPAYDRVADDVFDFEGRFWLTTYGGKRDKDRRTGRDSRFMHQTGALQRAATERGAGRQRVKVTGTYILIEITDGLAGIHERRGREVLATPGQREVDDYARTVLDYIFTGS